MYSSAEKASVIHSMTRIGLQTTFGSPQLKTLFHYWCTAKLRDNS